MRVLTKPSCIFALGAIALAGCASTQPKPYQGIESSNQMRPNTEGRHGHEPYAYNANVDWNQYSTFVMDPVAIYSGPDADFKKVTEQDKRDLAAYMEDIFHSKLRSRYAEVLSPRAGTLRVHVTLTGAKGTTKFLSTATHMDLGGTPINAVRAMRGREGTFMGSVNYAVEVYDASSNRLLKAYVDKQYPSAMSLKSTFGKWTASKRGIDNAADSLVESMK